MKPAIGKETDVDAARKAAEEICEVAYDSNTNYSESEFDIDKASEIIRKHFPAPEGQAAPSELLSAAKDVLPLLDIGEWEGKSRLKVKALRSAISREAQQKEGL